MCSGVYGERIAVCVAFYEACSWLVNYYTVLPSGYQCVFCVSEIVGGLVLGFAAGVWVAYVTCVVWSLGIVDNVLSCHTGFQPICHQLNCCSR